MKLAIPLLGIQQDGSLETAVKSVTPCFFSVISKRLDTSLYFLIGNFHTELKLQVNVSHDMNCPASTQNTTLDWSWTNGKPSCFDQVWLKSEVGWVSLVCTEVFFVLHVKSFNSLKIFGATLGIGVGWGNYLHCFPLATRLYEYLMFLFPCPDLQSVPTFSLCCVRSATQNLRTYPLLLLYLQGFEIVRSAPKNFFIDLDLLSKASKTTRNK